MQSPVWSFSGLKAFQLNMFSSLQQQNYSAWQLKNQYIMSTIKINLFG